VQAINCKYLTIGEQGVCVLVCVCVCVCVCERERERERECQDDTHTHVPVNMTMMWLNKCNINDPKHKQNLYFYLDLHYNTQYYIFIKFSYM